jgi:hypothetical protein
VRALLLVLLLAATAFAQDYECVDPPGADLTTGACRYSCLVGLCPPAPPPGAFTCEQETADGCSWWCLTAYCHPTAPRLVAVDVLP